MAWTPEKIKTLKRLWPVEPASSIGQKIGMTRNAVIGKAYRLGLDGGDARRSETDIARNTLIAKMYLAGFSTVLLAKEYNLTPTTIWNILRRQNVRVRTRYEAAKLRCRLQKHKLT